MTDDGYEVHAEVQGTDEFMGVFDGVATCEDGLALFRNGSTAGFIHYDRSPVATPVADADAAEELNTDADTEEAVA